MSDKNDLDTIGELNDENTDEELNNVITEEELNSKENHADIPINLQQLESHFIFHCIDVLRDKYKNIELLTIHDSICTVEGKEQLIYDVMIEEFQKMFNILPKIKIEKFA